jgi:hypothetical protein
MRNVNFGKEETLILKEAGLATTCLEQGLTALRKADFVQKWNYYQSFFLLSIGLERLLKLIIITIYRVEKNKLPDNGELKSYGHNIKKLYLKVIKEIDSTDVFLDEDILYISILNFLSDFSISSRYYNLDNLSGTISENDPLYQWKKIQYEIVKRHCNQCIITSEEKALIEDFNFNLLISFTDELDNSIDNLHDFYMQQKVSDRVQGYSVFYVYKLISHLTKQLDVISSRVYLIPYLNDFFTLFMCNMKMSEIVKRKNWNFLSNRR